MATLGCTLPIPGQDMVRLSARSIQPVMISWITARKRGRRPNHPMYRLSLLLTFSEKKTGQERINGSSLVQFNKILFLHLNFMFFP